MTSIHRPAQAALSVGLAVALSACSSASVSGKLTDAITGEPLPEVRVIAQATAPDASLTCQAFEATTGADGSFTIDGLCTGTGYSIKLSDDTLWVPDLADIPDGGAADLKLEAWRNNASGGLYAIRGGEFSGLRSHADVKTEKILNSDETVRFPWPSVPGKVPLIEAGDHLVLVGPRAVDTYEILPLIKSEGRKFGDKDTWVTMEPWYYIGTKFTDDETFERVKAEIDETKVVTKKAGERSGKYVPGSAVAPGRYVVLGPESRAVTIVDFGKTWTGTEEAKEEGEGEGEGKEG